jgi:hypothetical protein
VLCAGQEGGHHPRVPRETLMSLRIPEALLSARAQVAAQIARSLEGLYGAQAAYRDAVAGSLEPVIELAS